MVSVANSESASIIPATIVSLSASKFPVSAPAICEKMSKSAFSPSPPIISFINNVALPVSLSITPCINDKDCSESEFTIISDKTLKSPVDAATIDSLLSSWKDDIFAKRVSTSAKFVKPDLPSASCFMIARSIFFGSIVEA